jgi:exosortase A-associated hydrolase 1
MRQIVSFDCAGCKLVGTLDDSATATKTGLLIVSGGNEIRMGAHRGQALLASDIAEAGHPVFRFDRRGIGDSEGENGEFSSSAMDLNAALLAFRSECSEMERVVAFGNCDAASAILLHQPTVDAAVLSNIWVIERTDDLPPPAAIKARYIERMKDPKAWIGLFTGAINIRKLFTGLFRLAKPQAPSSLAQDVSDGLARFAGPISIIAAEKDATAIAFLDEWQKPSFDKARAKPTISLQKINSASHSFADPADYAVLKETLIKALNKV